MSQFGKYVALGGQDSATPFPESHTNWRELIYFRSWQAQGLVPIMYYFSLVVGIIMLITSIVAGAQVGVGGFFLGLIYGIIELVFIVIGARISAELIVSVYDMRDNVYRFSNGNGPTIVHGNPSNSTYQSYQQPQQSSSYQQPAYQQPPQQTQNQQTNYQEPYQGTL